MAEEARNRNFSSLVKTLSHLRAGRQHKNRYCWRSQPAACAPNPGAMAPCHAETPAAYHEPFRPVPVALMHGADTSPASVFPGKCLSTLGHLGRSHFASSIKIATGPVYCNDACDFRQFSEFRAARHLEPGV